MLKSCNFRSRKYERKESEWYKEFVDANARAIKLRALRVYKWKYVVFLREKETFNDGEKKILLRIHYAFREFSLFFSIYFPPQQTHCRLAMTFVVTIRQFHDALSTAHTSICEFSVCASADRRSFKSFNSIIFLGTVRARVTRMRKVLSIEFNFLYTHSSLSYFLFYSFLFLSLIASSSVDKKCVLHIHIFDNVYYYIYIFD